MNRETTANLVLVPLAIVLVGVAFLGAPIATYLTFPERTVEGPYRDSSWSDASIHFSSGVGDGRTYGEMATEVPPAPADGWQTEPGDGNHPTERRQLNLRNNPRGSYDH